MNNYAIARIFTRIADLMELQGDDPFKLRAYRNAAQTMQELTESLETLAERGELQTVPGIGQAIAGKTQEILSTGTCKLYEELKKKVPESLTDMLGLPGFGPKKIHTVWKELGVRSLDELESAAREQRLRNVKGLGARTEANLVEAIEAFRRRRERAPIGLALPYAEGLARLFLSECGFQRLEVAGSVRRMADMTDEMALAGIAADPEAALAAVAAHPEVREVLARSGDMVCVCTQNNFAVRVSAATGNSFGRLLLRETGSDAHLAALREQAEVKGVDLGALPGDDEEQCYAALGLPCIPPELREGRGEVDAAREGRLPRLIEAGDMRGILHAHSTWSDGSASIADMAAAARAQGYGFHGNTDHSKALGIAHGLDEDRLRAQMAEIDALNATFTDGFRVLKGIECDILADGALDLPVELLAELDFVIGSVHSHQKLDQEAMTRRIVAALESGAVDLLAHPTGRLLGARDAYSVDIERVFDAAVEYAVALEINAAPDRLDLHDLHARQAKERGIPISINTDAHRPADLASLRYGIAQARRAWLEADDVINTWPLERLLEWVRSRRRRG